MKLILLLGVYLLSSSRVNGQNIPTTQVGPCHRIASGFARDLTHCQQYFVCQNGQAIRQRCPGNLFFDAENQACWWREEVTCFQCPRTHVYSLQPVPNTCHQFYRCWLGIATIHACPSNLVFDPNQRHCNLPYGTGCEGDDNLEQTCPATDGPFPVFLADAYSCEVYHVCHGGVPIRRQCIGGFHFNPILQICDIPENANCQIQDSGWEETPIDNNYGDLLAKPCPETGNGFVPHRDNCNAYYACTAGAPPTLLNCAPGLHFDFERLTCDRPRNARCWSHENPPGPPNQYDDFYPGGDIDGGDIGLPGPRQPAAKPKTIATSENVLHSEEDN